jgi:acyl carrier protein
MESYEVLRNYFVNECGLEVGDLSPEAPLFSSGLLDSLEVVKLLNFCEETFKVRISPLEVSLEQFDSIEKISTFVSEKSEG